MNGPTAWTRSSSLMCAHDISFLICIDMFSIFNLQHNLQFACTIFNLQVIFTGAQPKDGTGLKMQCVCLFKVTLLGIYRCLRSIAGSLLLGVFAEIYRWFIEILSAILKSTRYGGESRERLQLFGNDTFPNLYDVLVYERKLESEYLERQIYERSLKSEPSIVKLIEKISDLSKLSTLSEPSIMKFIENQCEHLYQS